MNYEAEFAEGLLPIVHQEISELIGKEGKIGLSHRPDSLAFRYDGAVDNLQKLRTVIAVYRILQFDVPRPKALLGHQNFQRLLETIRPILATGNFQSLYLNAAGSDSSVMTRIKEELAQNLALEIGEDEGDLLLRMRRTHQADAWDVLVRLGARPIASREWRVCNYEGALNASIAAAMVKMSNPTPEDKFLNIACGSGTILIERANEMPAAALIGVDISDLALDCARDNIAAAKQTGIQLLRKDAIELPFEAGSMDAIVADLPFGNLMGSHEENEWLYPALLHEAARVAKQGAYFVVITHEIRLMEDCLRSIADWSLKTVQMVTLTGLHPRIFVLERR